MVIDVAKAHFPQMAVGFSDRRVTTHVCDGIKFVQDAAEGTYDVIIVDSSDPVGPAEVLFQKVDLGFVSGGGSWGLACGEGPW
jgi:spermidine synthase